MTELTRFHLDAALRQKLAAFIHRTVQEVAPGTHYLHSWHIEAIAWHLEQCCKGKIKRLLITLPPRALKSISASVAFPAFVLGHDPARRFICASYSNELTAKHARDCRVVMESAWYRRLFPRARLDPSKKTELEFETTARGGRYGTSVGGTLTGRGGNFIILDDPLKAADAYSETKRSSVNDWFGSTLISRLDDKENDVIVVIMQRLHEDDLVGHLLGLGGDWVHLDLPAIAEIPQRIQIGDDAFHDRAVDEVLHPARESREVLEKIKAEIGSFAFQAQYQQCPVPVSGNLVKSEWFQVYAHPPAHDADGRIIQSWDTASKAGELNDYSVCTTWLMKGQDYYLLHVYRARLEYPLLKKKVIEMAQAWSVHSVLIEDKGSGQQLIQDLRYEKTGIKPIAWAPEGDKVTRMSSQSANIEAGCVYLPEQAPWLDDFLAEVRAFPNGKFDDQVDSLSQFLAWAEDRRRHRAYSGRHYGMF